MGKNGYIDKVEVLGFIDGTASRLDHRYRLPSTNLLCKGSPGTAKNNSKTPEQHLNDIKVISLCPSKGLTNAYLEDWSNGMRHSEEYAYLIMIN